MRHLVWLLVLLFPAMSAAAPEKRPEKGKPDQFQGMTSQLLLEIDKQLDLSDEQKAKIVDLKKEFEGKHREALKQMREEVARIRQDMDTARKKKDSPSLKKANDQVRELRQTAERLCAEFETELLNILNDEQKKKYESIKMDLARPGKLPLAPEKKPKQ